ncbi:MAG TPA: cytochrome c3 family protein [Blastocatellia bacterium]|nr:cytochrome c3 family protein [Blastocatellia bacterium]
MTQIFHRSTNFIAKATIFGAVFIVGTVFLIIDGISRSSYNTQAFFPREQPVQFSHKHHVGDAGIDCRYCHTSVEDAGFAGIPPTKTCMNCHSQIFANSPYLEPVRESWRTGKPIEWTRVHDLPDFVYFDHSIHVNKGVGCSSCHGRVDLMPLVYPVASLQMEWCLQCHREPEKYLRPKDQIFNMAWEPGPDQAAMGEQLKREYSIPSTGHLTSCNTCHR